MAFKPAAEADPQPLTIIDCGSYQRFRGHFRRGGDDVVEFAGHVNDAPPVTVLECRFQRTKIGSNRTIYRNLVGSNRKAKKPDISVDQVTELENAVLRLVVVLLIQLLLFI